MKCPKCNATQPFHVKCVQCDTDLASSFKSEKITLTTYRIVIFILVVLAMWLTYRPAKKPAIAKNPEVQNQALEIEKITPSQRNRPFRSQESIHANPVGEAKHPTIVAFLEKENFSQYEILAGIKEFLGADVLSVDIGEGSKVNLRNYDSDIFRAWIAIGPTASHLLLENAPELPTLIVTLHSPLILSADNKTIFALGPGMPLDAEWKALTALFPEQNQWLLISRNPTVNVDEELVLPKNTNLKALPLNANLLERELRGLEDTPPIVWFHDVEPAEQQAFLNLPAMEKIISISGPTGEKNISSAETHSTDEEDALGAPSGSGENWENLLPLIEMKFSRQNLGRQGAVFLRNRLQFPDADNAKLEPYLRKAIEIHVHVHKALKMEKETVMDQIRESSRRAGIPLKWQP